MKKRHISLKDLADELNISVSTVSRALKNHPDISPEMTSKVQELAHKLNYTPNPLAMGLLKQQTKMIGVIVPDIVTHFYSSVISGIESVADDKGYFIVISSSGESLKKEMEAVENLMKIRAEGIIACISQETDDFRHFEKLIENEIPLVFFDRIAENIDAPSVSADNIEAAENITRHFYENGYRRIAYISGPPYLNISKQRKQGYLNGLKACGLEFDPRYLPEINLSADEAALATRRLLELSHRPDAIFGINDTVAYAAMKEIKKYGLKIPDDIGLVGVTDEFHSTIVEPQLTSVTHPTYFMGREVARLFFNRITYGAGYSENVILPTTLVIRDSSKKSR